MENDKTDWKLRFNDMLNTAQNEAKKATKIGMKMLSASQSNSQLHETYEALGVWLKKAVEDGSLKVDDVEVEALVAKAQELEQAMEVFEKEVQELKKENG